MGRRTERQPRPRHGRLGVLYLVGLLGQAIGLALFGIGALRTSRPLRRPGTVALLIAALHLLWVPSIAAGIEALAMLDQLLIGLGWIVLGAHLWTRSHPRANAAGREEH